MKMFNTNNELWTELKTFIAAMASADMYTTLEQAQLSAIHAKFASSTVFYAVSTAFRSYDANYLLGSFQKLLTRRYGAND